MFVFLAIAIRSIKLRRMRWVDMQHARKNTGVPTRSWLEYLNERDIAVNGKVQDG